MKKQQVRHKASINMNKPIRHVGRVVLELAIWDFSGNDDIISHNAGELAKALLMSYQLDHFSPSSFGIDDEE